MFLEEMRYTDFIQSIDENCGDEQFNAFIRYVYDQSLVVRKLIISIFVLFDIILTLELLLLTLWIFNKKDNQASSREYFFAIDD